MKTSKCLLTGALGIAAALDLSTSARAGLVLDFDQLPTDWQTVAPYNNFTWTGWTAGSGVLVGSLEATIQLAQPGLFTLDSAQFTGNGSLSATAYCADGAVLGSASTISLNGSTFVFDSSKYTNIKEVVFAGADGWTMDNFVDAIRILPEPTTIIAGALLLLPFGASTLRILRKKRAV